MFQWCTLRFHCMKRLTESVKHFFLTSWVSGTVCSGRACCVHFTYSFSSFLFASSVFLFNFFQVSSHHYLSDSVISVVSSIWLWVEHLVHYLKCCQARQQAMQHCQTRQWAMQHHPCFGVGFHKCFFLMSNFLKNTFFSPKIIHWQFLAIFMDVFNILLSSIMLLSCTKYFNIQSK